MRRLQQHDAERDFADSEGALMYWNGFGWTEEQYYALWEKVSTGIDGILRMKAFWMKTVLVIEPRVKRTQPSGKWSPPVLSVGDIHETKGITYSAQQHQGDADLIFQQDAR